MCAVVYIMNASRETWNILRHSGRINAIAQSSGVTPCRLVYNCVSIFTNLNGVTSSENLLIVITGIRITSHKKCFFSLADWRFTAKFKLDAHFASINCYKRYVTFNSEDQFSSAAILIIGTETYLF
jgi:DeoR/GlpR family transcriptional regulator of sugar metabolism